jgi:ATP-dependent helicase HrpB
MGSLACWLAALLSDTGKRRVDNLCHQLDSLTREPGFQRIKQQAQQIAKLAKIQLASPASSNLTSHTGVLLALAFPDRIGHLTAVGEGRFLLSNGRGAEVHRHSSLAREPWIVCAELGGQASDSRSSIYLAAPLPASALEHDLRHLLQEQQTLAWDPTNNRVQAELKTSLGAITTHRKNLPLPTTEDVQAIVIDQLRLQGLDVLPWSKESTLLCQRVEALRQCSPLAGPDQLPWPNMSPAGLLSSLETWLAPWLTGISSFSRLKSVPLQECLLSLLSWSQRQQLEILAPSHIRVPSGSNIRLDYSDSPPVLAVKLQEMFGCSENPTIADGRLTLQVHLLSPAGRPLQITQNLAGFWQGSYEQVRKEMKGRYPKHPWPEDPLTTEATRHTKHFKPRR